MSVAAHQYWFRSIVVALYLALAQVAEAQYDFPHDSCACHIHYEMWVTLQHKVSEVLTADFPQRLWEDGSEAHYFVVGRESECWEPSRMDNILEWTVGPGSSDCASGHLALYILCAQAFLRRGDLQGARQPFFLMVKDLT